MKTLPLVLTVAAGLFGVSSLHAQTTVVTTRTSNGHKSTTTLTNRRNVRSGNQAVTTPTVIGSRTDGVIPRAVRSGSPLQMVNPFAPAEYGSGRDVTRHEVDDPGQRPQGIKLYAIEF